MVTPSARGIITVTITLIIIPTPWVYHIHFVISRDGWGTRDQKPRQLLGCEARGLSRSEVQRADEQAGPEGPGQSIRKGEGKRHRARSQHKSKSKSKANDSGEGQGAALDPGGGGYLGVAGGSLSTGGTRIQGQDVLILERGEHMEEITEEARRGGTG